jgi:hypothetical protein
MSLDKLGCVAACAVFVLSATDVAAHARADVNVVVRWNDALLRAIRETRMAPPPAARAFAIVHTCMFDAWAAYDGRAVGTRLGATLRRPVYERSEWNKAEAISVAAHRALVDLFPAKQADIFDPLLAELGYAPAHSQTSLSTPAGIGRAAADAVLAYRHHDGANQLGDLTPAGTPYADYTGYQPVNDAFTLTNPNRWQPLVQADGTAQRFLVPHWNRVAPFALETPSQFRPPAPAAHGSFAYWKQALELISIGATLTDRKKAIAVYWADGPASVTPPGHWMLLAQAISRRDRHTLDEDAKLFFAVGNALLDASIAAWDCKVAYDYIRPVSAIRVLAAGHQIPAWAGPVNGTLLIDGAQWQSYIPTPPFAEYVSGHSTFSAAAAAVLRRFTGSDAMHVSVIVAAGSSPIEPGHAPASDVRLTWRTFSEAADQAGLSRRLGGIHFRDGDLEGRRMGARIGAGAWKKAVSYILGSPAVQKTH